MHACMHARVQGFGKDYLSLDRDRTNGNLYLHITAHRVLKEVDPAAAAAAPVTKFAIGVEGGFQTEDSKYKIEKSYEVYFFPGPVVTP